jgi:hypothetical protein
VVSSERNMLDIVRIVKSLGTPVTHRISTFLGLNPAPVSGGERSKQW